MRAIVLMFDSLNRRMLPPYGSEGVYAPNFLRLASHSAVFDRCYAGSMPCMPARRELHTGRANFLHRSWGPLEPFDDSVPEMLKLAGIHTHLVTDHQHYWEDGGATYHTRYKTFEFVRGQEGDPWKGVVDQADRTASWWQQLKRQDRVNRSYFAREEDHPQSMTFRHGLDFVETNRDQDHWMVQIETFDPHEPFFSYDKYHALYDNQFENTEFDWPAYRRVIETDAEVRHARNRYLALLSMCDANLGRLLDMMDRHDMWRDTMLIVCTDHGFMLGEQGWWGKTVQPWFEETIHTPLFVWDPRHGVSAERRQALVQTMDIGPTLLEFFGVDRTPDMQGQPIAQMLETDKPVRRGALFGVYGGHINVTDGRYVYMRTCVSPDNLPLYEYTLMPTHMRSHFKPAELADMELAAPFTFTKGTQVLKIPGWSMASPHGFGTLLFDLEADPQQQTPLRDAALELRMAELMVALMRENGAPVDQFIRVGLPVDGPVGDEHLLVERHWDMVQSSRRGAVRREELGNAPIVMQRSLAELMAVDAARAIILEALPQLRAAGATAAAMASDASLHDLAAVSPTPLDVDFLIQLEMRLQAVFNTAS